MGLTDPAERFVARASLSMITASFRRIARKSHHDQG